MSQHPNWEASFSWDTLGQSWQIDHIKALALFDLHDQQQLLAAVHYTNLQPLSVTAHIVKSAEDRRLIVWFKERN
jgi:hypothetical protein